MDEICIDCGAVPPVGVTASQEESLPAVKVSVPVPEFVTLTDCDEGFVPPCVALNVRFAVETESTGRGGAATTNVTVTVAGEPWAPVEVTVIWPV